MNAASLTKTIDRREQFYERYQAHQAVLMHRYSKRISARHKNPEFSLNTPVDDRQRNVK